MDFENLYNQILNIDKSIHYAVILSKNGEKMFGGYREDMDPILQEDELKMVHFYAVQRWDTRKNIEHRIGINKYSMGEYEKMKRFSFPIDEKYLLLIHSYTDNDHQKIISETLRLIRDISED